MKLWSGNGEEIEAREIVSLGNRNQYRVMRALGIVILFQLLPEPMNLNPDDGIDLGIEVLLPAKGFNADGVFLETLCAARYSLIRQELKQLLQR